MDLALKIMALVDEYPSELFSFERKVILEKLELAIAQHTQQVDEELDISFDLGFNEGREQTEYEYQDQINDLQDEINDLERQIETLEDKVETAFVQGLEAATRDNTDADTFELK